MDTAIILLNFAAFVVASSGDVGTFLAIRGVRLIRLGRSLRFTTRFRIMWHLLYGLLSSGQVLLATLALMVLAVYISACIGVELITRDADLAADPSTSSVVSNSFGSLRLAMLTIIQFITLDSIHQIYIPLVVAKPNLIFYFLAVLLILPITLMNLVTAVLVENSLTQAQQEADYESKAKSDEMKKAVLHLLDIFKKLDNDKDGGLSRNELSALPEALIPHDLLEALCVDNLVELFDLLDADQTGTIDRDEFVDGVLHMIVRDVPVETMRMMSMLQSVQHHLTSLDQTQRLLMLRTSGEDVSFL
ncbi:CACNA1H [Symbiodinium sp. KB8]|nr:CACNA1H [Symbiodinium sp. KB8]